MGVTIIQGLAVFTVFSLHFMILITRPITI